MIDNKAECESAPKRVFVPELQVIRWQALEIFKVWSFTWQPPYSQEIRLANFRLSIPKSV